MCRPISAAAQASGDDHAGMNSDPQPHGRIDFLDGTQHFPRRADGLPGVAERTEHRRHCIAHERNHAYPKKSVPGWNEIDAVELIGTR
jgi:hypothetical protein